MPARTWRDPVNGSSRSEPSIAGLHLPVALGLLTLGSLQLAVQGVSFATVLHAAVPIGLGSFVVLIVGTSRMLLSGTIGLDVAGSTVWWVPLGLLTVGTLGLWPVVPWDSTWRAVAGIAWGLGLAIHLSFVAVTLVRGSSHASLEQGAPVKVAGVGATLYGSASAAAVPLAAGGWLAWFPALHLVLAGFIVLTIVAVVLEVLPRFTGQRVPRWLSWPTVVSAVAGPVLLAWGLTGAEPVLHVGAAVELVGLGLLASALLYMIGTSELDRASFLLYGMGALAVLGGALIGSAVAWGVLPSSWIPIHGTINLLGFVGFVVLGATIDLYAPALRPGAASHHRHNRVLIALALFGLVGFLALQALGVSWSAYALVSYAAAAGLHSAGSVARLR